jgi:hypothetical protein
MPRRWCCWTMATRSRRRPEGLVLILATGALALAACSPKAPEGVDKATLDDALSRVVGSPNTCVMIAEADGGDVVYRYNTATACDRAWPACDAEPTRKVKDLVALTLKDRQPRRLSCNSLDPTRNVGWAAGPVPGRPLVYAAVMEGEPERTFPGLMMADRIEGAFRRANLSGPPVSE